MEWTRYQAKPVTESIVYEFAAAEQVKFELQ